MIGQIARDAFTAALTLAPLHDSGPVAHAVGDTVACTVARPGGRPDLPATLVGEPFEDERS